MACGQQRQRSAEQHITGRSLAGRRRLTGGDLDQRNEMHVPGNQDGNSKTEDSQTCAERQVSRPIISSRNHMLNLRAYLTRNAFSRARSNFRRFNNPNKRKKELCNRITHITALDACHLPNIILDDLGRVGGCVLRKPWGTIDSRGATKKETSQARVPSHPSEARWEGCWWNRDISTGVRGRR